MLVVKNLHVAYGSVPILRGVDFRIGEGEYLGILGHNGMGKSTLIRALMGLLPTSAGSIEFCGHDVTRTPTHQRSKLGMASVPQGREIFPDLSVHDNLRMGLASARKEDLSIIDEVLTEFPRLTRLLNRRGGALSGGEQQLLAIARCLCTRPRMILLDEPTEGIQPNILEEIIATLHRLKASKNITMILVEQNLDFITSLSERVLTIQKGVITGEISPADFGNSEAMAAHVGMSMS